MAKKQDHDKLCFVICAIGEPGSKTREHADIVTDFIITPAAEAAGFKVERSDRISKAGMITSQIIERLLNASVVVADLTFLNPNVMYELGVRHTARKPVVQIATKETTLPFDVGGLRTILFEVDMRSGSEARDELKRQLEHLRDHPDDVDSPVTTAVNIDQLSTGDDVARGLAEILRSLGDIKGGVAAMRSEMAQEESPQLSLHSPSEVFISHDVYNDAVASRVARNRATAARVIAARARQNKGSSEADSRQ